MLALFALLATLTVWYSWAAIALVSAGLYLVLGLDKRRLEWILIVIHASIGFLAIYFVSTLLSS